MERGRGRQYGQGASGGRVEPHGPVGRPLATPPTAKEQLMPRNINLFTGQWVDLPFEEVCALAERWG